MTSTDTCSTIVMWGCLADSSMAVRFHLKMRCGLLNPNIVVAEEGNVIVFFHWSTFMACYLCPARVIHFPVTLVTCVHMCGWCMDACWFNLLNYDGHWRCSLVFWSCDTVFRLEQHPSHLPWHSIMHMTELRIFLCRCYEHQAFVTSLRDVSDVRFLCLPICWVVTFPRKRQLMHCVKQHASSFFVLATPRWKTAAAPDGHNLNGKNCTHHAFVTLAITQSSAECMWRSLIFLCCCYKILWKLLWTLCKACHVCASDVYLSAGSSRHVTLRHILAQQAADALSTGMHIIFPVCITPMWAAAPESHNLCGKTCAYLLKGRHVCVCHTLYNALHL